MHQGNRAVRRHHAARIKVARRNHWSNEPKSKRELGMLLHTTKLCGCWKCSQQRRWHGVTIQERRELQDLGD